ncbi:MAG: J domain-containing protein [Sphingobacteriia bacterium]|nr:J domain-containing protein [Sphingobacteriia bacterium]
MHLQNWYAVLSVTPNASEQEIRQAYRRLAHRFHPDKNPGNDQTSLHFQLIKEAYEVLSNPKRRSAYDRQVYLGNSVQNTPKYYPSAAELTDAAARLHQDLLRQNQFFINRDWLFTQCMELLSPENRQLLLKNRDRSVIAQFLKFQFESAIFLTYRQNIILSNQWKQLSGGMPELEQLVSNHLQRTKRAHLWDKSKIWVAIGIGITITLLIVLS